MRQLWQRWQALPAVLQTLVFALVFALLGLGMTDFQLSLVSEMLIAALFALSLNLIMGYGGMVHFGHAAFYGLGGYTVAILTLRYGVPTWLAMGLAPFVAALGAVIIGWFCVRRVRLYFSILTLAFGQLLYTVVFQAADFTGGDNGLLGIPKLPFVNSEADFYYFTLVVFFVCFFVIRLLVNSPFVLVLRATRENAERAQFVGVNVRRHQLIVFVIGAFFAGVSGAMIAEHNSLVAVDMFFWATSSEPILGSLLGGMYSLVGPAIGGALLIYLEVTITRFTLYWPLVLGILTVFIVLVAPSGLVGLVRRWLGQSVAEDSA